MKKEKVKVRVGMGRFEDVDAKEVKDAGFSIEETDTKQYATQEIGVQTPESIKEAQELLDKEEIISILQKAIKSKANKEKYDEIYTTLKKEVPKEVAALIASMKDMADSEILPFKASALDKVPFEAKTSKEALKKYVSKNLK